MTDRSRPPEHFQRLYEAKEDPWGFTTSAYERDKYRRTMAALGDRRFASGLEVGCSIGVLTGLLAERCDRMLGLDIVEAPLITARMHCADQPGVRFECRAVPDAWPDDMFDLIVLSEVLYFLSAVDIDRCAEQTLCSLHPGGLVVLVNWLGPTDDPTPGHEAAERFIHSSRLKIADQHRTSGYRLDVLRTD